MNSQRKASATILVVDDSAMCRESIADMLRSRGYSTICAESGDQALAILASQPVDLVLLDMLMPVMDGLSVLRTLRRNPRFRQLPVILLTDVAHPDIVRKVAALGVQGYLLKAQFSINDLLTRVKQHLPDPNSDHDPAIAQVAAAAGSAVQTDWSVQSPSPSADATANTHPAKPPLKPHSQSKPIGRSEVIEAVLNHLELNPVPPVLHQVLSQTHNSASSIHDVVESIRRDQALSVRVMKVANSSFYATGKPPRNVTDAASRLGMSGIRSAVVPAIAIGHFSAAADTGLIPQRFWEHSLSTAAIAQAIAETLGIDYAEELFLAGLLHDLGRLLMTTAFPEEYAAMISAAKADNVNLGVLEREAFDIEITEVTREALTRLGIPAQIATVAALHQRPAEQLKRAGRDGSNGLIVALADRLARAYVLGHSGDDVLLPLSDYVDAIGLGATVVRRIGRQVAEGLADAELFYACHGNSEFLRPLCRELAESIQPPCKVAVVGNSDTIDPVNLFFEQLGWLDSDNPEVIVISQDKSAPADQIATLNALVSRVSGELPCLFVVTDRSTLPSIEQLGEERNCEFIDLASRYSALVEACARLKAQPVRAAT